MTDQYQKDLDNAAKVRHDTQVEVDAERTKAEEKLAKAESEADRKFVKEADRAEASAMNRDPITGAPGSHPVGTGIGTTGGMIAGATLGSLGGPIGTAIGGLVGAIVGAAAGHSAGEAVNPTADEIFWRDAFVREPYYNPDRNFDDYSPAYRAGYLYRNEFRDHTWEQAEPELQSGWESNPTTSRLRWEEARPAARAAWYRADESTR